MTEANPLLHQKNVQMLMATLEELRTNSETANDVRTFGELETLVRKELDKIEASHYIGIECDSDQELQEDEPDECLSDDEDVRNVIDYDLDKMFDIIWKRDFNKWDLSTIHQHYPKVSEGDSGQKQISRMRSCVKRGSLASEIQYRKLRDAVWDEVYSLLGWVVLYDNDLQLIAMAKAKEMNLDDFKASDGWTYFFKNHFNIVDRFARMGRGEKTPDEEKKLRNSIKKFKLEQFPTILAYLPNKIWNVDQRGLQLELPPGRPLVVRGPRKELREVHCVDATAHSYTIHIQLNASGKLSEKLPIILYESDDVPKRAKQDHADYQNLQIYSSKSDLSAKEMAKLWMAEVFVQMIEEDSLLIVDSWTGYEEMLQMPQVAAKKLKIIQLPAGTSSHLQPVDVFFNRPFKGLVRRVCNRVRWQHTDFHLEQRENFLSILDMLWYQCKAPRFEHFLMYPWFRTGYTQEHHPDFETPEQFCLDAKGFAKCETSGCTNFCFLKCAYCERHFCFNDALKHRDNL